MSFFINKSVTHAPLLVAPAATDNHIGYMEKDPVRFNDSLEAFEEVLKIAKAHDVRIGRLQWAEPERSNMIAVGGVLKHAIALAKEASRWKEKLGPPLKSNAYKFVMGGAIVRVFSR